MLADAHSIHGLRSAATLPAVRSCAIEYPWYEQPNWVSLKDSRLNLNPEIWCHNSRVNLSPYYVKHVFILQSEMTRLFFAVVVAGCQCPEEEQSTYIEKQDPLGKMQSYFGPWYHLQGCMYRRGYNGDTTMDYGEYYVNIPQTITFPFQACKHQTILQGIFFSTFCTLPAIIHSSDEDTNGNHRRTSPIAT